MKAYEHKQPIVYKILNNTLKSQQISHAYLFESNGYQNTLDVAKEFVMSLECENKGDKPCMKCASCLQILSDNFLDLKIIEPEGLSIKKKQLEDLQKDFSRKSALGKRRIYIVKNAEKLNPSSSNSILKFLEEPPANIIAILITENAYNLLDTISSRCQLISFKKEIQQIDDNLIKNIAINLFTDSKDVENYAKDLKNEEKIKIIFKFFQLLEKNKNDMLLFSEKYFHSIFKKREEVEEFFKISLLIYQDVLNESIGRNLKIFKEEDIIHEISKNNDLASIYKKINLLIEYKEKLNFNVNIKMMMDTLIIKFAEV